jgi:deoxyribonuclease-4
MLQFAVAGAPLSTPSPGGTVAGLKRAHDLGITAMELEWVQNVPSDPARMDEIRKTAEQYKMTLTVHAPYYVNLNSQDSAKLKASVARILHALTQAERAGAISVCVHAAFYLGMPPEIAYKNIHKAVSQIMSKRKLFPHVNLALETMGKPAQFGTLEEVLRMSNEFDIYPCVDPAHLHARSNGAVNTAEEWDAMFDAYEKTLGKKSLQQMHLHFSGIEYTAKGERRHLPLQRSDAKWKDFLHVLKRRKIGGVCVSESPLLEDDTLLLQKTYAALR